MTFTPTIRNQSDLESAWRTLMEPLGFSGHSVWFMIIGADDHPYPGLTEIEDSEEVPEPEQLGGLGGMLTMLTTSVAPEGRVAFLLTRPGRDGPTRRDRDWAGALYATAAAAGVPAEVIHLANDVAVLPLPMDEVLLRTPA